MKNILGLLALVVMFTACSKDPELFTPSDAIQNPDGIEKKGTSKGEDACGKPSGDNSSSGLPVDKTTPYTGPKVVDSDGISDDDDDESDDDTASRIKTPK